MTGLKFEQIFEYKICKDPVQSCVAQVKYWLEANEKRRFFACANPHSIIVADSDPLFKKALLGADFLTADGVGIVIASKLLGGSIRERVTGWDIFISVTELLNRIEGSAFFLGSTKENLINIKERLKTEFPNVSVVGTYSPPFRSEFSGNDNEEMISAIRKARPDVLWVGMTAPKQEKWIYRNLSKLDVKFIGPIGAVFDFFSNRVKRSHPAFQKVGLEWLPRLLKEPKRMWKRNFISSPEFMFKVIKKRLNSSKYVLGK